GLATDGTTVLLTTQYLEEADQLATELAVLDHGQVIEHGTPAALKARVGGQTLDIRPAERVRLDQVAAIVAEATGAIPTRGGDGGGGGGAVDGRVGRDEVAAMVAGPTGATPTGGGDGGMVSVPVDGRLAGTRTLAEVAHRLDEGGRPRHAARARACHSGGGRRV